MALLSSLFSRKKQAAPTGDAVEQARARARRRLVGAAVLIALGVIAFPLLFETQPRPIAVNVPIEIPRRDAVPPLNPPAPRMPAAASHEEPIAESRADAARAAAPAEPAASAMAAKPAASAASTKPAPAAQAAKPAPPTMAVKPAPSAMAVKPAPSAPVAAITKPAASAPAAAKPAPSAPVAAVAKPAASAPVATKPAPAARPTAPPAPDRPAPAATAGARMVVQVGAYADANAARDARERVERLGLKAFMQVVDTDAGKRIRVRVGPFVSRDEADQAAGRIKSAGLPAAVMGL